MNSAPQSSAVEKLLRQLEGDADIMRKVLLELVAPPGSQMFPLDFLAFAAVKRHTSTTKAFISMIQAWNMAVARALLRMHIDTSLRFSAAWQVQKPHEFATLVLKGERIDKMKTMGGQRLTDAYLVQLHSQSHPWLPAVYAHLSGYVHFSGSHIADAIHGISDADRTLEFLISDEDLKFPEGSWIEILQCFRETSSILRSFLQGWGKTKWLSPSEFEEMKQAEFSGGRSAPV